MSKYEEESRFQKQAMAKSFAIKQEEQSIADKSKLAAEKEKEERIAREKAQNQEEYLR